MLPSLQVVARVRSDTVHECICPHAHKPLHPAHGTIGNFFLGLLRLKLHFDYDDTKVHLLHALAFKRVVARDVLAQFQS